MHDPRGNNWGLVPTAYDTAWVAAIRDTSDSSRPMFPASLDWLMANQLADGSWGGAVRYEHDRILSTLAAVGTIAGYPATPVHRLAMERGVRYLWQHGHLLAAEPMELVGFELLLAALIERATNAGVQVPAHLDIYGEQRETKLRLVPPEMLYSSKATVAHSLEFLGDRIDVERLLQTQVSNGSIGNAPAATALFVDLTGNAAATRYLIECMNTSGGAAVPVLYPCDVYESLWSAYQLWLSGASVMSVLDTRERARLLENVRGEGVSLAPTFPAPDADETSVALLLLHEAGERVDPTVLQRFETAEGHFASFPYERHASLGVNVHVLHALLHVPNYPDADAVIGRLLDYVEADQRDGMYWLDKWHISPYYATSHVACVLADLPPHLAARFRPTLDRTARWLIQTQNRDGSWGYYGEPTLEETGYAVTALRALARCNPHLERGRSAAHAGARYLASAARDAAYLSDDAMPPLWIDKCLYSPRAIVKAAVAGALGGALVTSKQEQMGVAS